MSELDAAPAPSKKLLVARLMALAGIVGLGIAAFFPLGTGDSSPTAAALLTNIETYAESGRGSGQWALVMAFVFPPILLVFWGTGLLVRNRIVRSILGWIACLVSFGILLAVALEIWKVAGHALLTRTSFRHEPLMAFVLAWLAVTAAATLACLSLCAAPVRLRLAGCVGAVGLWCAVYFLLFLAAVMLLGGGSDLGVWLILPAVSSLLIALGGTMETFLLWRRSES